MATILTVDTIATDADLAAEMGQERLDRAKRTVTDRDAIRAKSLDDVIAALGSRSPPVLERDVQIPSQLKDMVVYRALWKICRDARATPGDVWDSLANDFRREYERAVTRPITVQTNAISPSGNSIRLERR